MYPIIAIFIMVWKIIELIFRARKMIWILGHMARFVAYIMSPWIYYPLAVLLFCWNVMFLLSWHYVYLSIQSTEHIPVPSILMRFGMWNYQLIGYVLITAGRMVYTCFGLRKLSARDLSWWESWFIQRRKLLRNILVPNEQSVRIFPCHNGHTHPRSAEFRSSANEFMIHTVENAGYTPYVVSRANKDRGDGSRYYYHAKDYHVEYRDDEVKENHCFIFTDVDYYADMNRWLSHWKPILLYTLVPKQISYQGEEFAYFINNNNILEYHVKGGAQYKHPLWHYKGDTVCVVDTFGAICIFDIEQREVEGDPHHRLIWLLPKARIPFLGWIINPVRDGYDMLKRLNVRNRGICYLWNAITDELSVRSITEKYSVEIGGKLFHSIKSRLANKDTAVRTSDIERMLNVGGFNTKESVKAAPLLLSCWDFNPLVPNILTTGTFSTNFEALPGVKQVRTEDAKHVGQIVTTPVVNNPALFAAKGLNADRSCIEGRVNKPRNTKVPTQKYFNYAREFVEFVVPERFRGTGAPLDADEVREKQDGKLQRSRFDEAIHGMSVITFNKLKAFIKTETYNAAKPPRNITTMSPELTINMSAYTIPFSAFLKKIPWYAPGKSPKQIIKRIKEIAQEALGYGITSSDYDTFDGSVNKFLQENVTFACMMRWLAECYRAEYKRFHMQVFKKTATTSEGEMYDAGDGTRSGSPITTYNTLKNAYNTYAAYRNMGYKPKEAWAKLGLYAGDDGATANKDGKFSAFLAEVALDLGQLCKPVNIEDGKPFPFCGRYFVNPLLSDDTFQDPLRTLGKIHLSGNKGVSREQAAANKAHGYLSTDALTPLIGTYCRRVLALVGDLKFKSGTHEEQYKCSNSWPQHDRNDISNAMADVIGYNELELIGMDKQLSEVQGLDQFPVLLDTICKHKMKAVVDGEVVGIDPHNDENEQNTEDRQPTASARVLEQGPIKSKDSVEHVLATDRRGNKAKAEKPRKRRVAYTRNSRGDPGKREPHPRLTRTNGIVLRDRGTPGRGVSKE